MDVMTSHEPTHLSWSDSAWDPNRLGTRCAPGPPTRSRGCGRGCAVWPRHPVPHLSSGSRPPNEPGALQSQTKATPTSRGRKGHKFIPAQQEAGGGSAFPGPTGDTQGPSFMPLLLNELEAGQGPRGRPGLGLGGESWCARGPWPAQGPPPPHHRERTQLTPCGLP